MKEAIQKAVEGGYVNGAKTFEFTRSFPVTVDFWADGKSMGSMGAHAILLDPLFWQALSRAEKWTTLVQGFGLGEDRIFTDDETKEYSLIKEYGIFQLGTRWEQHWHDFIDHLASGGTSDEFFSKLLK